MRVPKKGPLNHRKGIIMTKRKYDFGVIIAIISLLPILVTFIPLESRRMNIIEVEVKYKE